METSIECENLSLSTMIRFDNQGAENFWTIPEYGEILFWGDKSLDDYEKELETLHDVPEPSIYRYPKCRQFKQVW